MIATHCHPFHSYQKIIEFLPNLWWIANALLMCSSISTLFYRFLSLQNSKIKYKLTEILKIE